MRKIMAVFLAGLLFLGVGTASAVVIEGATPTGNFRSVGVSDAGELSVSGTVTVSTFNIITGNPTSFTVQGTGSSASPAINVTVSTNSTTRVFQGETPWIISPSSTTRTITSQFTITAGAAVQVLTSTGNFRNCVIGNDTDIDTAGLFNVWLGSAGVTAGNGKKLYPGQNYSPDSPYDYLGSMFAASTATVVVGVICHLTR